MDHAYALQICLRFCLRHAHVAAVFAYIGHISILLAGSAYAILRDLWFFLRATSYNTTPSTDAKGCFGHCEHGNAHHASSC